MAIWNFNVTHQDQTQTTGSKDVNPPGNGQSVNIPNVPCLCGHNHTLVGSQANGRMSGAGIGSVAPPNDPHSMPGIKDDGVPSWDGGPVSPDPDVDEDEAGDEEDDDDDDETPSA
jgi:hypothetical protein